ncbi:ATP-binding protein, partial [Salinisphaera sp.]|uniref:ATP-binding protein n=1 Tax=Salinisphaera sp. TaxID=1914330 RepID=UPI002D77C55A
VTSKHRLSGTTSLRLERGVIAFPSVGDQVLIPTPDQITAIVGATDEDRRVQIGESPAAANAPIMVDPDKIFGRHLAVLGNTGSGKSCSVAGLVRWSLEAAQEARLAAERDKRPNARFIILDPNGEYSKAFQDFDEVRVFRPGDENNPLHIPAWLWNSHEWAAVSQAQPGAQRPLLNTALRHLRAGRSIREPVDATVARLLNLYSVRINALIADTTGESYTGFPGNKDTGEMLAGMVASLRTVSEKISGEQHSKIAAVADHVDELVQMRSSPNRKNPHSPYYSNFSYADFQPISDLMVEAQGYFPTQNNEFEGSEDAPVPFEVERFADYIDDLAANSGSNANIANFIAFLTLRIRSMTSTPSLRPVITPGDVSLEDWLNGNIGQNSAENGNVAIIDLSMVPSEATHTLVAVFGRLVFEACQRYQKQRGDGKSLPTALVLEEAHTFVRRGREGEESLPTPARLCREAFERIAREGRKFGVGMVLSSQRPYELSPTVLAQCNTFLLHRIVNDSDQDLVRRLVPDNVGGMLRDLPSLPSRQAILLGWATPLPVLVEVRELSYTQRPKSDDPDYWAVWTGERERDVDWGDIAREWSGMAEGE